MDQLLNPQAVIILGGLAIIANRLVAALITPLFDKYGWDKFWILYIAWVVAGVLVWLSGANAFDTIFPSALVGQIVTALVAGGGANILHDLTDREDPSIVVNRFEEGDTFAG